MNQTESASDDDGASGYLAHLLRRRIGGNVKVFRRMPDQKIADCAADNVGFVARLLQSFADRYRKRADLPEVDLIFFMRNDPRLAPDFSGPEKILYCLNYLVDQFFSSAGRLLHFIFGKQIQNLPASCFGRLPKQVVQG